MQFYGYADDGLKFWLIESRSDVRKVSKDDDVYYIGGGRIFYKGEEVGRYDMNNGLITWYDNLKRIAKVQQEQAKYQVEESSVSASEWDELLQPINDMIAAMLERELI